MAFGDMEDGVKSGVLRTVRRFHGSPMEAPRDTTRPGRILTCGVSPLRSLVSSMVGD